MKILFALILPLISFFVSAQNADTSKFVFASMPHNTSNIGGRLKCTSYYSNGYVEDLNQKLGLSEERVFRADAVNDSIRAQYEFKMLNYFYNRGYELIGIVQQNVTAPRDFYFKHK